MKTITIIILLFKGLFSSEYTGNDLIVPVYSNPPEFLLEADCIGISDPNTDTIVAMVQAVERALAFYAINRNMELSSVYEYYYLDADMKNNYNNQKSHWMAEIHSQLSGFSYEIENMFFTENNELIVSLDVDDNDKSDNNIEVDASFMYYYDYLKFKSEYGEKQFFNITSSDFYECLRWESIVDNDKSMKKSYVNDNLQILNMLNVKSEFDNKLIGKMMFSENKYSLWDCYVDTFFQAMSVFESNNLIIENTTRQITIESNEDFNDKSQNIIRIVMKTELSCKPTKIMLKNNVLYADWEVVEK